MHHLLRAFLVTSMLAGIAGVHAGETANGRDLNGVTLNGVTLNALGINGIHINRLAFNGTHAGLQQQLNGVSLQQVSIR